MLLTSMLKVCVLKPKYLTIVSRSLTTAVSEAVSKLKREADKDRLNRLSLANVEASK